MAVMSGSAHVVSGVFAGDRDSSDFRDALASRLRVLLVIRVVIHRLQRPLARMVKILPGSILHEGCQVIPVFFPPRRTSRIR